MRFRCPITLPNRLTQLDILLLCNHIVHDIRLSFLFQWSLPQGERRSKVDQFLDLVKISIHAPTRGATFRIVVFFHADPISIHAPTRGATKSLNELKRQCIFQSTLPRGERRRSSAHNWDICNFNPRSHEGSDPCSYIGLISLGVISIHAPTRGATHTNLQKFQP